MENKMQKVLFSLSLLFSLCADADAEPVAKNSPWIIMGNSAQVSCGKFISLYNDNPLGKSKSMTWQGETYYGEKYVYLQWAWGFLTGMNLAQPDSKKQIHVDGDSVELWLKEICEANPTNTLVDAINTFASKQLKKRPPVLQ